MVFCEVSVGEMPVRVYCNSRWAGSVVQKGSVKESFTWRWCHLTTVCVACRLNLFGDCHSPGSNWVLPWVLGVHVCNI